MHVCVLIISTSQSLPISPPNFMRFFTLPAVKNIRSPFSAAVFMCTGVGASVALLGPASLRKTASSSPKLSSSARSSSARGERQPWSFECCHSWHLFMCTVLSCAANPVSV